MPSTATRTKTKKPRTATHRPATRRRRYRHDNPVAVDLFSGFGGLTDGIKAAGFLTIMAANHNAYKVEVHEANHPDTEHWIADLVDPDASDYHDARDLPAADLLVAGVSCVNHSQANTVRAYEQGLTLFGSEDPDYEARVTKSERDRATANCVLHYAQTHRPRLILVECTTELTSWGPAVQGKTKVGDGSTYRWWLGQFDLLNYNHRVLYLNSQFFGVPQSRDRLYIVFWDKAIPAPDLDHRPVTHCHHCDQDVEAVWTWKTGIPATGAVRYGKQYDYRCPRCRFAVVPPMTPSLAALDLSDLGIRIGDRPLKEFTDKKTGAVTRSPLAPSTMARAERCRQKFAEFPAIIMPAKGVHGSERHPWQPMATQTSQQEAALLSAGQSPMALAVDNYQGAPRPGTDPLPTQVGSETLAVVSSGVIPFRQNTLPTVHAEAMPTVTSDQIPGLLTAAGTIKNNGSIDEAAYRAHPVTDPLGTLVGSSASQSLLFSGWYKQNGSTGTETAPHPMTDPLGTLTARDTTAFLMAEWRASLRDLPLEDCYFRMMGPHEVGRGCGFDVDFGAHKGTFIVWGTARAQVDGYGNAVSKQVGEWIGKRLRAVLHDSAA
ncbi:MAG: DNA cytosine methyltransferase [Streptomyces sp.]|nr:DNA cytosine methyltransferase [Streptomyces sp.]NUS11351.1 DNA cytosine methyltransferase [Streptomyces sp.]NUS23508.1 DNA cytosine methyltransferase [Streptomyces sp.]